MKSFEDVEPFYKYLIIDEDGWKGIKDDAPESARMAYAEYMEKERADSENGIKS